MDGKIQYKSISFLGTLLKMTEHTHTQLIDVEAQAGNAEKRSHKVTVFPNERSAPQRTNQSK